MSDFMKLFLDETVGTIEALVGNAPVLEKKEEQEKISSRTIQNDSFRHHGLFNSRELELELERRIGILTFVCLVIRSHFNTIIAHIFRIETFSEYLPIACHITSFLELFLQKAVKILGIITGTTA